MSTNKQQLSVVQVERNGVEINAEIGLQPVLCVFFFLWGLNYSVEMLRMAACSVALLLSSGATKVANAYAPESSWSWSPSTSLSSLPSGVILRIRLSDGKVVRLVASGDNTVQELMSKLVVMGHDVGGGLVIPSSKKCM